MTENKVFLRTFGLCLALSLCLSGAAAPRAFAAGGAAAPAMMGVQEILVKHTYFGNSAASDACGLLANEISDKIIKTLKKDGVPAYSVMSSPVHQSAVARVNLLPEIVSLHEQGLSCTSWISLSAQTRETVKIDPISAPRSVSVVYWRGGLLISSAQTSHARAVSEALEKLTQAFSKKYRFDQPPPLPEFDEE